MTEEQKHWIDTANYETFLLRHRFAPLEDEMFQGDSYAYFVKKMNEAAAKLSAEEMVATSKRVGWKL